MSFAGLLGAGLLGGVSNAAKGIGDRLREEAKQKREFALQDRAEKKAQGLADTDNKRAVEAATQVRIHQAREGRLNRHQQSKMQVGAGANTIAAQNNQGAITGANTIAAQNNQGAITGANTIAAQNNQGRITGANTIAAQNNQGRITGENTIAAQNNQGLINAARQNDQQAFTAGQNTAGYAARLEQIQASKVDTVETFYDEETGMQYKAVLQKDGAWKQEGGMKAPDASTSKGFTLQNGYNAKGEEVKGYMSGTTFVQVGAAKAVKATTEKEARDYLTKQAKFLITGASNSFMATKLSDEDASLVSSWVDEGMTSWKSTGSPQNLSSIVKNVMFKPWKLKDADITSADLDVAEGKSDGTRLGTMKIAREIATRRQPDFITAQTAYTNELNKGGSTAAIFKRMRKMGYDPALLTPPPK